MNFLLSFLKIPAGERYAAGVILLVITVFYILLPAVIRYTAPDIEFSYEVISRQYPEAETETEDLHLSPFDPNAVSYEELVDMGLSPRLSRTWVRFRERVSPFREPEDLMRLYGMDSVLYANLEPYVEISTVVAGNRASGNNTRRGNREVHQKPAARFHFDPNVVSVDSLQRLGFPRAVARTIGNFRDRGGRFHKPEDLLRIFNMPENLFYELEPWVRISSPVEDAGRPEHLLAGRMPKEDAKPASMAMSVVDINHASAEDWRKFRGIGAVLSARIIDYRDQLGGFYRADQLAEVRGIPDSVLMSMLPYLEVSNKEISKIDINTATREELAAHPYISGRQAGAIVNYRNQNGMFEQLDHVLRIYTLDKEWFDRVKPYLRAMQS